MSYAALLRAGLVLDASRLDVPRLERLASFALALADEHAEPATAVPPAPEPPPAHLRRDLDATLAELWGSPADLVVVVRQEPEDELPPTEPAPPPVPPRRAVVRFTSPDTRLPHEPQRLDVRRPR